MANYRDVRNTFKSGMISKKMFTHEELEEHANGASEILNMIPEPFGGVFQRTGTRCIRTNARSASNSVSEEATGIGCFRLTDVPVEGPASSISMMFTIGHDSWSGLQDSYVDTPDTTTRALLAATSTEGEVYWLSDEYIFVQFVGTAWVTATITYETTTVRLARPPTTADNFLSFDLDNGKLYKWVLTSTSWISTDLNKVDSPAMFSPEGLTLPDGVGYCISLDPRPDKIGSVVSKMQTNLDPSLALSESQLSVNKHNKLYFSEYMGSASTQGISITDYTCCQVGDILIVVHTSGTIAPFIMSYSREKNIYIFCDWFASRANFRQTGSNTFTDLYDNAPVFQVSPALRQPYLNEKVYDGVHIHVESTISSLNQEINITVKDGGSGASALVDALDEKVGRTILVDTATYSYAIVIHRKVSTGTFKAVVIHHEGTVSTHSINQFAISYWGGAAGFPTAVSFFQGRLVFGGGKVYSEYTWFSALDNIFWFKHAKDENQVIKDTWPKNTGDKQTSDPFSIVVGNGEVASINWIYSSNKLVIGSFSSETVVSPTDAGFSSEGVLVDVHTAEGSSTSPACIADNVIFFIDNTGRQIKALMIDGESGRYNATTFTASYPEIYNYKNEDTVNPSKKYFKKLVYNKENKTLYAITTGAKFIITFSLSIGSKLKGWAIQEIGYDSAIDFEILDIVSSQTVSGDAVFIQAIRGDMVTWELLQVRSETDRITPVTDYTKYGLCNPDIPVYLDHMHYTELTTAATDILFSEGAAYATADEGAVLNVFKGSDTGNISYLGQSGTGVYESNLRTAVVTAFDNPHRDGNSTATTQMTVIADGVDLGIKTVTIQQATSGASLTTIYVLKLDVAASKVFIGHRYARRVALLPPQIGSQIGTSQMAPRRIDRAMFKMYISKGGTYGVIDHRDSWPLKYTATNTTTAETIDIQVDIPSSPDKDQRIYLEEDDPLKPINVLAVVYRGDLGDG